MLGKEIAQTLFVRQRQHHRVLGKISRYATAARSAERGQTTARLNQQMVGMTVVTTFEFHNHVASGHAARQSNGAHDSLGAGAHESHLIKHVEALEQGLGQQHLAAIGRSEATTLGHSFFDGRLHVGIGVAQDHRTPALAVVDVLAVVFINKPRTLGTLEEHGITRHGLKRPHRRIHTAGQHFLSPFPPSRVAHLIHPSRSASRPWYVMIRSAPARRMASRFSSTMARSSQYPAAADAFTMEYSPLTL